MQLQGGSSWHYVWCPFHQSCLFCGNSMLLQGYSLLTNWLTQSVRFRSVTHQFAEVGHTHGPVDQRLSIASTAFGNEKEIQTPAEVCLHSRKSVPDLCIQVYYCKLNTYHISRFAASTPVIEPLTGLTCSCVLSPGLPADLGCQGHTLQGSSDVK